jgi:hypothetical protein
MYAQVGVEASQDGLMADEKDVLLTLELHDDRFEADNHISVRLAAAIPLCAKQV